MQKRILFLLAFVIVACSFIYPVDGYAGFSLFGQHKSVRDTNGEVMIPLTDINDGTAHYFVYKGSGKKIKFFVVKSTDGIIRAAFDACDVCFPAKKGYSQQGEFMICNNCGRKFHSTRINVEQGGCNPAPLYRKEQGGKLVIAAADILAGGRYF
jgi:uncharacterized membrane protein